MKKSILNLAGTQALSQKEQKMIKGGKAPKCCIDWDPVQRVCYEWQEGCER